MNACEWSVPISELARREHSALAELLLAVAEFDAQEVYRRLGVLPTGGRSDGPALPRSGATEAKQLVAERRPVAQVPWRTVVTEAPLLAATRATPATVQPVGRNQTHPARGVPMAEQARTLMEPMTATATRIHITVSPEFVALLKRAKAGSASGR